MTQVRVVSNTVLNILLICMYLVVVGYVFYHIHRLDHVLNTLLDGTANPQQTADELVLSPAEVARIQRHQEFDARIEQIAKELHTLPEAQELHPLVRNLPHSIISTETGSAPNDVEIAD